MSLTDRLFAVLESRAKLRSALAAEAAAKSALLDTERELTAALHQLRYSDNQNDKLIRTLHALLNTTREPPQP